VINRILLVAAAAYGVTQDDIIGRGRTRHVSRARHVAMWLARQLTVMSYEAIGAVLGGRDHTTVLYAVRKIEALHEDNQESAGILDALRFRCGVRVP